MAAGDSRGGLTSFRKRDVDEMFPLGCEDDTSLASYEFIIYIDCVCGTIGDLAFSGVRTGDHTEKGFEVPLLGQGEAIPCLNGLASTL